jgi:hypothetical protein
LPAECEGVAWLDADIVFGRRDWPLAALAALGDAALVQPFLDVHDPGGAGSPGPASRQSLAFRIAEGRLTTGEIATARLANEYRCAAGLVWVARRAVLERHGLYDAAIVGGGDRAIACAAYGAWSGLERTHRLNDRQLAHYLEWARPFAEAVQGRVGYVDGGVSTLAHGSFGGRAYGDRHAGLEPFGFDPTVDIALDEQGCWRWNSDRPALHEYVRQYFERRGD